METVYTQIGRGVVAEQRFEVVLTAAFEFFRMVSEETYLGRTGGYIPAGAFKVPVKNVVKALAARGNIAPDLKGRLNRYAEDRHKLIHRLFVEYGWPAETDAVAFAPIVELAQRVEREANALTRILAGYLVKYGDPDRTQDREQHRQRIAELFHLAHIEFGNDGV